MTLATSRRLPPVPGRLLAKERRLPPYAGGTIAEALEKEVREGATPVQVKRAVLSHTQRIELALRCEQAARWLVGE